MAERDLISVVMPSYNHARYVETALNSILNQNCSNIQLVIVDDGSRDQSCDIIQNFISTQWIPKRGSDSVAFISQANRGAHHALNAGLDMARGHFLTILNSDDYFEPQRLKILKSALRESKSELAFSLVRHVNESGGEVASSHSMKSWYEKDLNIGRLPTVGFQLLRSNVTVTSGNLFFTKALWKKVGHFSSFKLVHDYDFVLRSLFFTEPIFVKRYLLSYRVHDSNTIQKHISNLNEEIREVSMRYFKQLILNPKPNNKSAPAPAYWKNYYEDFWQENKSMLLPAIGGRNPTAFL